RRNDFHKLTALDNTMAGSLPSKGRISLPARRLSVRKIKEVLRLKFEVGLGLRQIARSCSIGLGTAPEYLQRAEAAKIRWRVGPEWDDDRLEAALFGGPPRSRPTVLPMPDFAELHRQRQQHSHVTQQLLWEEYRQANPDGYQYSRFCELYQRWRRKQDVVLRQEHKAGEKLFVDWAGTTIPIHDPRGGPVQQAHLFVAVMGASSYTYAEATADEQLASWIGAHVRAFEFYQGVPKLVVPDNTKTGVTKACRYDPRRCDFHRSPRVVMLILVFPDLQAALHENGVPALQEFRASGAEAVKGHDPNPRGPLPRIAVAILPSLVHGDREVHDVVVIVDILHLGSTAQVPDDLHII